MKKIYFLALATTLVFVASAQPELEELANATMDIQVGGTFGKPKILPKLEKLAIAQSTVYFKNATTREILENERGGLLGGRKSGGGSVAGRLTAWLETSDGELTDADYQELSDGFYTYLAGKLNAAGITTVDWNTIANAEFYKEDGKDVAEVQKDLDEMKKKGQVYHMVNSNKGNVMWKYSITGGISPGFAFGKGKRALKFCDEMGAPVVFMHVTVDFADIFLDGDVFTNKDRQETMFYTKVTSTKKYGMNAEVGANMKVSTNGICMFINSKGGAENLVCKREIPSGMPFAKSLEQDPSKEKLRSRDNIFAKDFNMVPFVITTTKAQYKAAARKALENYADLFVAKILAVKK